MGKEAPQIIKVGRRSVTLSNPSKLMYPRYGFSKSDVVGFYRAMSGYLLPHLRNRALTLKRYPDGIEGEVFYEKRAPRGTPEWVKRFSVARSGGEGAIDYVMVNDEATLVWVANLASLELHPLLSKYPNVAIPSYLVFDLDPGPPADLLQCIEVAFLLKEMLDDIGLECFPKISGSKGLQVYVPLNRSQTFDVTGPFAHAVAQLLETRHPDLVVSKMSKELRKGKVFIDWSQNSETKTTVCVYSLRAKHPEPFVSLPYTWKELQAAARKGNHEGLYLEAKDALRRVKKVGDLFAPVLTLKQTLKVSKPSAPAPRKKAMHGTGLVAYRKKRNFSKTPEPPPRKGTKDNTALGFVIQKHDASRLHYDFRLEMNGVLRSWAVPKGPPTKKGERRLAMHVEDHPLDYGSFEGIIPEGNYGAGTVMLWDAGTYENTDGDAAEGFKRGKLHVRLDGKKLKGEWVLVKGGREENS